MTEERTLLEILDQLIDYCRRQRLEEVVDHLLEAQMAWAEAISAPANNILTFPTAPGCDDTDD